MRLLLTFVLLAALVAPVYAASDNAATVEKAKTLADDAAVVLTGSIVSREAAQKDMYIFKDATGEIRVKIERKVFRGNTVTPENQIRITGKMDKDEGKDIEIDVKSLEVLK